MQVVIAPDSFKGSLTAKEVGLTIQEAFAIEMPEAEVLVLPMADGGEGTLDTLVFATNGRQIPVKATGPLGDTVHTSFGVMGQAETAIVEVATIAGLPMVPEAQRNPLYTTTYGLGEVIRAALDNGLRTFVVGLGGSATNDGGLGMLQALGALFLNSTGQPVQPIGASLGQIATVNFSTLDSRIKECTIQIASDVQNPLCGPEGASFVYGPQKGATPEQVVLLEEGMHRFAQLVEQELQQSLQAIPGAGAAGGLGFAFLALGATIEPGASLVAKATSLEGKIKEADWVITGEGQSDYQTLFGKLPLFVSQLAQRHQKKTLLLSGSLGQGHEQLLAHFDGCYAATNAPTSLQDALENARPNLLFTARSIARLMQRLSQRQ